MRRIAQYMVDEEPIARGGMGQIFKGYDSYGTVVAVKEILPQFVTNFEIMSRLQKEVDFLLRIDHPSIVKFYSAFLDEATQSYFIVMEYVEGLNLEQYIAAHGAFDETQAVQTMGKILDAMQWVHNSHIVHRDIKPSNIMIRNDGSVCLLDFGIAKDMDNALGLTQVGTKIGTYGYMSPEQAEGMSINYRTDIYSLGCVLYYMLTGTHAFSQLGSEYETKEAIISNDIPRLADVRPGLSASIQKVLDKATARNMMQRYATCYDFKSDLQCGTHVSHSNGEDGALKISIGRENCDITVRDSEHKISRHHADVELREFTGGIYYVFSDCSANGTIFNGRLLHKTSVDVPADGPDPEIYLAGILEGRLDWSMMKEELRKRYTAAKTDKSLNEEILKMNHADDEDNETESGFADRLKAIFLNKKVLNAVAIGACLVLAFGMGYLTFYMFRPHIDTQPSDYSDTLAVETVLPESVICDSAAIDVPAEPKQPKTYRKERVSQKADNQVKNDRKMKEKAESQKIEKKTRQEEAAAAKLDEEMKNSQQSYKEY